MKMLALLVICACRDSGTKPIFLIIYVMIMEYLILRHMRKRDKKINHSEFSIPNQKSSFQNAPMCSAAELCHRKDCCFLSEASNSPEKPDIKPKPRTLDHSNLNCYTRPFKKWIILQSKVIKQNLVGSDPPACQKYSSE